MLYGLKTFESNIKIVLVMFAIKAYELYNTRDNTREKQAKA